MRFSEPMKNRSNKAIDYVGLCLVGLVSLGFLLYYRSFAKLHIYLSFLKAPFFVGDMVFAACFVLFLLKWLINPKRVSSITWIALGYFMFVSLNTLSGYYSWGPLALRHSVMFYYPFLAGFVYSFYRPNFFGSYRRIIIISIFLFIFRFMYFHPYFNLTCILLTVILINKGHARLGKLALIILLVIFVPYKVFFYTSRSFMIGNTLALTYILCGALAIYKIKRVYKAAIFAFFALLIAYGLLTMSSRSDLKSLIGFEVLSERFNMLDNIIRSNEDDFLKPQLQPRLYNEKRDTFAQLEKTKRSIVEAAAQKQSRPYALETAKQADVPLVTRAESVGAKDNVVKWSGPGIKKRDSQKPGIKNAKNGDLKAKKTKKVEREATKTASQDLLYEEKINRPVTGDIGAEQRDINVSYANTLFRIFIWRDAFREIFSKMPHSLLGFGFGKPFRSHALEVLGWAISEWMVDGWICIHNSYIDLMYRAGIIGLVMILAILFLLVKFTAASLRKRSLTGILLTGILINWFVAANFLEVLEMPYSAIPLWSLFGLNFAYLFKVKDK